MKPLYLHTSGENVWIIGDNGFPQLITTPASRICDAEKLLTGRSIRMVGSKENARTISALMAGSLYRHAYTLQLATPLVCATAAMRRSPATTLESMQYCQLAPSQGGFHVADHADCTAYALATACQIGDDTAIIDAVNNHVAWPSLGFIGGIDKYAAAHLLAEILDPRWYVSLMNPDRTAKLEAFLGLNPKTQAAVIDIQLPQWQHHNRCATVMRCWYSQQRAQQIESGTHQIETFDFLWRVWMRFIGPDHKSRVKATLRTSQRFIVYLRLTWLAAIYAGSAALPEGGATLFRAIDFFADLPTATMYQDTVGYS